MVTPPTRYTFGELTLTPQGRMLERNGELLPLPIKAVELLLVLVEQRGKLVTKEELLARVWPDVTVEENSLNQAISALRKALGDNTASPRYIETVPRRGYRFLAAVSEPDAGPAPASPPATSPPTPALAVLPFRFLGAEPAEVFFGLGLADAVITRLSRLPHLAVRPTSAVERFAHGAETLVAVRELAVSHLLEGSLRKQGDRLAATVQLVRGDDGTVVWAERLTEELAELFTLEETLAEKIARALELGWPPRSGERWREPSRAASTTNARAYLLYLKGRHLSSRLDAASFEPGLECFREALRLDPAYALAYEGLAYHYFMGVDLFLPPTEAMTKGAQAAERAIQLAPDLAAAHGALGSIRLFYDWSWERAEPHLLRALELEPDSPHILRLYAWSLNFLGRFEEAATLVERTRERDSYSLDHFNYTLAAAYFSRRYDEGIRRGRDAAKIYPDFWLARVLEARCHEESGDLDHALELLERVRRSEEAPNEPLGDLGRVLGRMGRPAEARRVLAELEERASREHLPPFHRAMVYVGLGEWEACLEALEAAVNQRSWYALWLKVAPFLDPLRTEPRFEELCRRVGL